MYIIIEEISIMNSIHFILTYQCTGECDHCFLYCGPRAEGVFTLEKIESVLRQAKEMRSIDTVYFEGGEPFLFYPLLLESVRRAKKLGFSVGIVSNAYWAVSEADVRLYLRPLAEIGIDDLSLSDDAFHSDQGENSPAKKALRAAKELKIPCDSICIEMPRATGEEYERGGNPVVGGGVLFKGRAADKLIAGLPRHDYKEFDKCPHEELAAPKRVHIDPYGFVHICQGIVIGNVFKKRLKAIMADYVPEKNPIIGPLLKGGPAWLAESFGFDTSGGFVDHCHLCFETRRALLDRYPECIAPRQVYGIG